MTQKFLIAIVSILVFAVVLSAVVWNVQKRERQKQAELEGQEMIEGQEQEGQESQNREHEDRVENMSGEEVRPPDYDDWKEAVWKTYRDEKNGFEIQYPDSHFLDKEFRSGLNHQESAVYIRHSDMVRYLTEINNPMVGEMNLVGISIKKNNEKLDLRDWLIRNNNYYSLACNNEEDPERVKCEEGGIDLHSKLIKTKNSEAILLSEYSITSNSIVLFRLSNGEIVQFYWHGGDISLNEGDNFFANMIETFKIID